MVNNQENQTVGRNKIKNNLKPLLLIIIPLLIISVSIVVYFIFNNTGSQSGPIKGTTDSEKIKDLFNSYLDAGERCDLDLAMSIITEESKEIIRFTCSNIKAETNCYKGKDYQILIRSDVAIVHFSDFISHKQGWPFFFIKENDQWKIDFYKMAMGIVMSGSGCDTGWGWRHQEIREEFCSFFPSGECPDK